MYVHIQELACVHKPVEPLPELLQFVFKQGHLPPPEPNLLPVPLQVAVHREGGVKGQSAVQLLHHGAAVVEGEARQLQN